MSAEWAKLTNAAKKIATDLYNNDLNAIRVFEKKPTLPYVFPYESTNSYPSVNCDKLPTLKTGVTLDMVKNQLNKKAQIMGLAIPFPEEYNYIYLFLLLLVVVVVIYTLKVSLSTEPPSEANMHFKNN